MIDGRTVSAEMPRLIDTNENVDVNLLGYNAYGVVGRH
jgi:hypothetical protein